MSGDDRSFIGWGPVRAPRALEDRERVAASFDLMEAALNGTRPAGMLTLVVERARLLAHVPLAFVALPDADGHTLRIEVTAGPDGDRVRGSTVRLGRSMLGRVFSSRRALSARVADDQTPGVLPAGPILILPLETGEATRGVLAVLGRPGAQPFSPTTAHRLLLFADMAARLIELAEARRAIDRGADEPHTVLAFPSPRTVPGRTD
ncbi:GAF domain-containing protein [Spirillospora sp. NPDC052242]